MRVEQADEGTRVVHDEFSLEPLTSAEGAKGTHSSPEAPDTEPDGQVGDLLPDLIVDHTGKLLRIEGLERLRTEALARMSAGVEETPESRARLERWIARTVSESALTQRALRDWSALVSAWAGAQLAVGVASLRAAGGGSAPGAPSSGQISVTPRVPCYDDDRAKGCVRIELETHPAPEVRNTVLLITEPDRLVPHDLRVASEIHGEITRPDGKPQKVDQRSEWGYHFSYARGA
jgi:hypothetical protein